MKYCLEKQSCRGPKDTPRIAWKRYAVCGKRTLLERVRKGQAHPEQWRVVLANVGDAGCTTSSFMKEAG